MIIADVGVSRTSFSFDTLFGYRIPLGMDIKGGERVIVPFGAGDRHRLGIVLGRSEVTEEQGMQLKELYSVVDESPFLSAEQTEIVKYLKDVTMCTYYEAFRAIVPPSFGLEMSREFTLEKKPDKADVSERAYRLYISAHSAENAEEAQTMLSSDSKSLSELIKGGFVKERNSTRQKILDKTVTMLRVSPGWEEKNLTPMQKKAAEVLEREGTATAAELSYLAGCSQSVIKKLLAAGAVLSYEVRKEAGDPENMSSEAKDVVLSPAQNEVYEGIASLISDSAPHSALLRGVTGSGKTMVFAKLIEYTLSLGKTVIVMIPEISLTPQTVQRFTALFGETVAVMHSGLSMSQRASEYGRLRDKKARIAVGTRSAVFSPLENIGLIIMDEEGERTYRSERNPRYSAKETAAFRCARHGAVLLMASATPSVESYYSALNKNTRLFELTERYRAFIPRTKLVNTAGLMRSFSDELIREVNDRIKKGEQSIILLNRRGYNTYARCTECKTAVTCPNCSVGLTYHKKNRLLMCHMCGHSEPLNRVCPACGLSTVALSGAGTQKLEEEIQSYFPDARVLRMDADTTYSRFAYENSFEAFRKGEYDIMVGTQMIAKGLDFPNVTLVGVTGIDRALCTGDFRAYERTFSLITQVVGRSGRGEKPGLALIQTAEPDHFIISLAAAQDYKAFYEQEIKIRKAMLYPPFCDICVVGFTGISQKQTEDCAALFESMLRKAYAEEKDKLPLVIYRATACDIEKIGGHYRFKIVLKCKNDRRFRDFLGRVRIAAMKDKEFKDINIYADINGDIP